MSTRVFCDDHNSSYSLQVIKTLKRLMIGAHITYRTYNLLQPLPTLPNSLPVIPRIRRPHNSMRVILRGLLVRQEHARVVIKLHQNNRTLHAEVECIRVAVTANPAKVRLGKVLLDLG